MRSTRPWTTSSALALLAVVACSRGHHDEPAAAAAEPVEDDVARKACACETLPCIDAIEHKAMDDDTLSVPVRTRIGDCADQLGRRLLLAPFRKLTDDLCACPDLACYKALAPRVAALTDPRTMLAAYTQPMLDELQREKDRFLACDRRWTGGR